MFCHTAIPKYFVQIVRRKVVLLDLDDTLIETFLRQYAVISDFITSKSLPFKLSYAEYVAKRKAKRLSNSQLYRSLIKHRKLDDEFKSFYLKNIEDIKYLEKDALIVNLKLLERFKEKNLLVILSLRNNLDNSILELKKLGLFNLIEKAYFINHHEIENPKIKTILKIKGEYEILDFIGDSKKDHEAALSTGIHFSHVKTGLESEGISSNSYSDINMYLKNNFQNA